MAKAKNTAVFFCQECGYESVKWMGQCPGCKTWNSFVEEKMSIRSKRNGVPVRAGAVGPVRTGAIGSGRAGEASRLSEVVMDDGERIGTGMEELDRVLGGGIVPGSLTLVGGDPGIGKSTLLLQVCQKLVNKGQKVLYISGEESLKQIKIRAERIGEFGDDLLLLCETNLDIIEEAILHICPCMVVIDSIQTMYSEEISAAPGSVSQVREATGVFLQLAKGMNVSIFIVGHVLPHTRACISINMGLVPSIEHATMDPLAPSGLPSSINSDGFFTSVRPSSRISNTPISFVDPNLFFTPLRMR